MPNTDLTSGIKREPPSSDDTKLARLHTQERSRAIGEALKSASSSCVLLFSIPFLFLFLLVILAPGQTAPQSGKGAPSPAEHATAAPSPDTSKYVGAETCKTCHEEIYNAWEKSPHWKTTLNTKGGPSKQGCEGCHGPGADHVAGGGDKSKIFVFEGKSTKEINTRCLTCHAGGTQHMNAINS